MISDVLALRVLSGVNPLVAFAAERDGVAHVEAERGVARPRHDVMRVKRSWPALADAAPTTRETVARVHGTKELAPVAGRVGALSLGRAAVSVVRVRLTRHAVHPVLAAAKMGLRDGRLSAERRARLIRVLSTGERIRGTRLHVAVGAAEVLASAPRRDAELAQLFVDPLRVASDEFRDVVGRHLVINVPRSQPHRIEMVHAREYSMNKEVW